MKRLLAALLALAPLAAAVEAQRVPRQAVAAMEKSLDSSIKGFALRDPIDLVGFTRGVYLEDYGAVFSVEVDLAIVPISPFNPKLTPEQIRQLREKKLERLAAVKNLIRAALVEMADGLETLPRHERIAIAVTFVYRRWELREGLPGQVLFVSTRQALLDHKSDQAGLVAAIRVGEEF